MAITKVTNSLVATNAIQGTLIADNAITSVHIAQNQVTAVQIPDGSITSTQLGANSVDSSELVDGSIDTSHIADAQITTAKLGTNQVTSAKIAQNSIEARHIADGSITDTQLGSGAFTMGTITTTGAIRGPASLTIDPATVGDNTGTVVIAGNLQVDGTTTTVNSTTVDIVDKNITLGKGGSASANNGGGITIDGAAATLLYQHSDTSWQINKPLGVTGGITTAGNIVVSGTTLVSDDQTNDWVKQSVSGTTSTLTFGNTESTSGQAKWEYTRSNGKFKGYIGANAVNNFMTINSSGKVAIGSDNPAGNLQVYTSANRFQSLTGAAADLEIVSDNNTNPVALIKGTGSADLLNVFDNTTEVFTILDGGNVGIGKTNPLQALNVHGRISSNLATADHYYGAWLDGNSTSGQDSFLGLGPWHSDAGYVKFIQSGTPHRLSIYTANTSDHVTLQESGGKVGIGHSLPDTELHVVGSGNSAQMPLIVGNEDHTDNSTSTTVSMGFGLSRDSGTVKNNAGLITVGKELAWTNADVNIDSYMSFSTYLNNAVGERVRITSAGKVGIGTTAPGKLLTLSRTTEAQSEQLEFRNVGSISNGNFDGIKWSQGATGATMLAEQRVSYYSSGVVDMSFNLRNEDNVLYLKAGGNVGIGTPTPAYKLDISGTSNDLTPLIRGTATNTPSGGFNWATEFIAANLADDKRLTHIWGKARTTYGMAHISYLPKSTASESYLALGLWGANDKLNVLGNGNVGIGTSTPAHPLSVQAANAKITACSTADSQVIGFQARYLLDHATLYGSFEYHTGDAQLYIDNHFAGNNGVYGDINFRNKNNGGGSLVNRMKIKGSTGNVGIGTDDPTAKLDVNDEKIVHNEVIVKRGKFVVSANVNRRIRITLSNYAAVRVYIAALRTNGGNCLVYWNGYINNNNNVSYNHPLDTRSNGSAITYSFTDNGNGTFDWDFNNTGSGGYGTFLVEQVGGGEATVTQTTW
jgi:hypothetical protein